MRDRIQEFLDRKGLKEKPPKLVCLVYNGHGMQHGGTVYLLPEGANPTRQNSSGQNLCKPDKEFVALSDVFDACYEFDCHARRLEGRQDVTIRRHRRRLPMPRIRPARLCVNSQQFGPRVKQGASKVGALFFLLAQLCGHGRARWRA